ncbi:MAG TPA: sigma-70 family RNA polymerase sigma factor [Verrucomicrobiales bacterium]|jgi:RNA polymerase sigma-70 factor (ECF subfamily)|nr:sigma-70 family RNA polymerase sigma factor [Verrucomicrobiales bacterium]
MISQARQAQPYHPTDGGRFTQTRWSLVLEAGRSTADATHAMEHLCRVYWPAVYGFLRGKGRNRDDAQDLTQAFFTHILEQGSLQRANPQRGKFRTYLLGALSNFVVDQHRYDNRIKRGGGVTFVEIDADAEENFLQLPSNDPSPEKIFDRRWRLALLDRAVKRLGEECAEAGKGDRFAVAKEFLTSEPEAGDYERVARELGLASKQVGVLVHRLRQRLRALVREEVAETVAGTRSDVDEELRQLFS